MKGIVLAGGSGTRLYPITKGISKQLLPVYDKPMIYYPISILMLSGITEILIISTPEDLPSFKLILGSGEDLGLSFSYAQQDSPDGLAQAFIIGEEFIGKDDVCLVLGDNIFYGDGLVNLLNKARINVEENRKSTIFGYSVKDPERYGVACFDKNKNVISIEEKPKNPKSKYAVIGLYYYTNDVIEIAKDVKPSKRGELEITSVNQAFLERNSLQLNLMGRGFAWLDTGTHQSLLDASKFIETIETRQGLKIACLEEIAHKLGYINGNQLEKLALPMKNSPYGEYLLELLK